MKMAATSVIPARERAGRTGRDRRGGQVRSAEYDIHGVVGIRVVDAAPADIAAVARQLGVPEARLRDEPDIVIRFADRVGPPGGVSYLGIGDVAYGADAFLVLKGKQKTVTRAQIPLDDAGGGRFEIVCEHGARAVPLLVALVNLTALAKGVLPLHASAFLYRGAGVVVTGWTKSGKTEALLAFMTRGAQYVGDEWVYLDASGDRVFGLPEPIRLWEWHLRQLPQYRALLPASDRRRLRVVGAADALAGFAGRRTRVARMRSLVQRQLHADVDPAALFGAGGMRGEAPFDRLFFVATHDADEITIRPGDPAEVARRMVFSLLHERLDLTEAYLKFRFAFPERRNPLLEAAEARQRELLERALVGKPTYVVQHPYPFDLGELFDAMSVHC